ncbi:hypothetical protein THF5H11_20772 [Vibrio jasicida]|nr:hypothetical protein THF5H11_20772 [Vibrio jasicida]
MVIIINGTNQAIMIIAVTIAPGITLISFPYRELLTLLIKRLLINEVCNMSFFNK